MKCPKCSSEEIEIIGVHLKEVNYYTTQQVVTLRCKTCGHTNRDE